VTHKVGEGDPTKPKTNVISSFFLLDPLFFFSFSSEFGFGLILCACCGLAYVPAVD
jgi:hypothetical protein